MSTEIPSLPHGISVIDTYYYQRARFAASHLLIENGKAAFIDVGTTLSRDFLMNGLHRAGVRPEDVSHIILTHIHLDHAGGAGVLMQRCPNATLVVHPKGAPHMINPETLVNASRAIYGADRFRRLYGEIPAIPPERVLAAEDNYVLNFQGRRLHFLHTPGHARHHCCIWDPANQGLFSGDTMGTAYPELQTAEAPPFLMPTTSPAAFEPDALEESIMQLQSLKPATFYLTHFGPVANHPASITSLITQIRKHADLGRTRKKTSRSVLRQQVRDILYEAYCEYRNENIDKNQFSRRMAIDIDLNTQGIEIWAARQRKKEEDIPEPTAAPE